MKQNKCMSLYSYFNVVLNTYSMIKLNFFSSPTKIVRSLGDKVTSACVCVTWEIRNGLDFIIWEYKWNEHTLTMF